MTIREFVIDSLRGFYTRLKVQLDGEKLFTAGTGTNSIQQKNTGAVASGECSYAEGSATTARNAGEHAEGKFNVSIANVTMHTVGIGTASTKKNAHTITTDGKHYIPGIGTYVGTETSLPANQDLATIVNSKATITGGQNINIISQSDYNNLSTKDANTLYVII